MALVNPQMVSGSVDEVERGRTMRFLANAAAFFIALSVMGGLILAQRDYQNRWGEPSAIQTSATAATDARAPLQGGDYNVVLK